MKLAIILISALLLGACASYDGRGLQPGVSSIEDIQRVMGEPAMRWRKATAASAWPFRAAPPVTTPSC